VIRPWRPRKRDLRGKKIDAERVDVSPCRNLLHDAVGVRD
jgi:hypothetical protein